MKQPVPARPTAREGRAGRPGPMHGTPSDDDIDWP
jgi:hypothetical protein